MVGVLEKCDKVSLEGLSITDEDIKSLLNRSDLRVVELKNCDRVTDLSPLENIFSLEEIHIINCRMIRCLGNLEQCYPALQKLVLLDTPITGAQVNELNASNVDLIALKRGMYDVPVQSLVKSSIDLIREYALRYKPQHIGIAFNGGKDCIVMMDLLSCVLGTEVMKNCCMFILSNGDSTHELPEVKEFRELYAQERQLDIITSASSMSMKDSLMHLKETRGIEVVFMGTRSSDSTNQKMSVEQTSAGWPSMLRVCPIFDWSYADVWGYTLNYGIPYCSLYKRGFTSLGSLGNTFPNPELQRDDGTFRPAWELSDVSLERTGRVGGS